MAGRVVQAREAADAPWQDVDPEAQAWWDNLPEGRALVTFRNMAVRGANPFETRRFKPADETKFAVVDLGETVGGFTPYATLSDQAEATALADKLNDSRKTGYKHYAVFALSVVKPAPEEVF